MPYQLTQVLRDGKGQCPGSGLPGSLVELNEVSEELLTAVPPSQVIGS